MRTLISFSMSLVRLIMSSVEEFKISLSISSSILTSSSVAMISSNGVQYFRRSFFADEGRAIQPNFDFDCFAENGRLLTSDVRRSPVKEI